MDQLVINIGWAQFVGIIVSITGFFIVFTKGIEGRFSSIEGRIAIMENDIAWLKESIKEIKEALRQLVARP
ncbi:MAG: hypothetical protein JWL88_57 [Parcubacteria group bacterium]|nr:hypothetical protein [Parcubacteria group bacterium]